MRERAPEAREELLAELLAPLDDLIAEAPELTDPERDGAGAVDGGEVCAAAVRTRGGAA